MTQRRAVPGASSFESTRDLHASITRSAIASRAPARRPLAAADARRRVADRGAPRGRGSNVAHSVPAIPSSASGWTPTGVASTGTSQASASSTARPKPSRSDGTSTTSAALTHDGTSSGGDVPERQELRPGALGDLAGAVGALLRAGGVGREEGERRVRVESRVARGTRRGRSGWKRSRSTPLGSTFTSVPGR